MRPQPRMYVDTPQWLDTLLLIWWFVSGVTRFAFRYVAGRELLRAADARPTNATFLRDGTERFPGHEADRLTFWAYMAGWKRAVIRLIVPILVIGGVWAYFHHRWFLYLGGALVTVLAVRKAHHRWKTRMFRRVYLDPLARAAAPVLNIPPSMPTGRWLSVSPELPGLLPNVVKPMSRWEKVLRTWYGQWLEPILRFIPDRLMRAYWWAAGHPTRVTNEGRNDNANDDNAR